MHVINTANFPASSAAIAPDALDRDPQQLCSAVPIRESLCRCVSGRLPSATGRMPDGRILASIISGFWTSIKGLLSTPKFLGDRAGLTRPHETRSMMYTPEIL